MSDMSVREWNAPELRIKRGDNGESMLLLEKKEEWFEEKMLKESKPEGILPLKGSQDGYWCYELQGQKSLAMAFERVAMNLEQVVSIVHEILGTIEAARKYLLREDGFLLLPDYIFVGFPDYRVSLCYYPAYHVTFVEQLSKLFELLLNRMDYREERAISVIYALYMQLQEPDMCIAKLQERLHELVPELPSMTKQQAGTKQQAETKQQMVSKQQIVSKQQAVSKQQIVSKQQAGTKQQAMSRQQVGTERPQMGGAELRATARGLHTEATDAQRSALVKRDKGGKGRTKEKRSFLFGGLLHREQQTMEEETALAMPAFVAEPPHEFVSDKTRVLKVNHYEALPSLVSITSGEEFALEHFPLFIGSLPGYAQLVISKDTVSRFHAKLLKKDGEIYLTDLNSTNGTELNGRLLEVGENACLEDGDRISFAKEEYCYQCGKGGTRATG